MTKKDLLDEIVKDSKKLEIYLKRNEEGEKLWKSHLKYLYDKSLEESEDLNLKCSSDVLSSLHVENLDNEQIWQQIELLNEQSLDNSTQCEKFEDANLLAKVALLELASSTYSDLSGLSKTNSETKENSNIDSDKDDSSGDEGVGLGEDEIESEFSNYEEDLDSEKEGSKIDDSFEDDDFNEGDFNDIALNDDDEEESEIDLDEDDNESDVEDSEDPVQKKKVFSNPESFSKTSCDSTFLQIRESEWVADNDLLGENCTENFEDIDMMEDINDNEDDDDVMFGDFFDPPTHSEKPLKERKTQKKKNDFKENDDFNEKSEEEEENLDTPDIETDSPILDSNKKEGKSLFEKLNEQNKQQMEVLENNNIGQKEWVMKGEIQSADRPENSVLEEDMEITVGANQRPVTTEETTVQLEKFILGIVRNGAYDNVERKSKPIYDPNEYKKKLLLDQTKSKLSLAEVYEEEYLKQQQMKKDDNTEEPKEHKEIKEMMDNLFPLLDALTNYHYTPKAKNPELKIVSNLPALAREEAAPVSCTDASLLAPQEVVNPLRGDLKGVTEETTTDKKRQRRKKKDFQKTKAHAEELKTKMKLKKLAKDGKSLDIATSAKVVEKAIKRGQVQLMGPETNLNTKKKRKGNYPVEETKKKAKTNKDSSKKLLL